jgi:hypothetical protein
MHLLKWSRIAATRLVDPPTDGRRARSRVAAAFGSPTDRTVLIGGAVLLLAAAIGGMIAYPAITSIRPREAARPGPLQHCVVQARDGIRVDPGGYRLPRGFNLLVRTTGQVELPGVTGSGPLKAARRGITCTDIPEPRDIGQVQLPYVTRLCIALWVMSHTASVQQFGPGTLIQVAARGRYVTQLAISDGGSAYRVSATTPAADAALAAPGDRC